MNVFRNSLWYYKGLKEYTKSGFENASKKFNPADLEVNCNGQSFMITGANSGLGKQVMYMIYIYRVTHMYLNDFVRLFRGHWVT
jgi:dehydrogenase/reductase SDR family protein 12